MSFKLHVPDEPKDIPCHKMEIYRKFENKIGDLKSPETVEF